MKQRTKSEWLALIEAHAKSGQTAAAFCREHGLNAKYFSTQRQRLGDGSLAAQPPFLPVAVQASPSVAMIEVELPLVKLRLPTTMSARHIAEIVQALRS